MTTSSNGHAAAAVIADMSEEELAAWITAGDYSSVGGVAIPESMSQRIADAVGYPEVVGLGFDLGFGMPGNLAKSSGIPGPQPTYGHVATPGQTHHKPGGQSFQFLKVTLADILISG